MPSAASSWSNQNPWASSAATATGSAGNGSPPVASAARSAIVGWIVSSQLRARAFSVNPRWYAATRRRYGCNSRTASRSGMSTKLWPACSTSTGSTTPSRAPAPGVRGSRPPGKEVYELASHCPICALVGSPLLGLGGSAACRATGWLDTRAPRRRKRHPPSPSRAPPTPVPAAGLSDAGLPPERPVGGRWGAQQRFFTPAGGSAPVTADPSQGPPATGRYSSRYRLQELGTAGGLSGDSRGPQQDSCAAGDPAMLCLPLARRPQPSGLACRAGRSPGGGTREQPGVERRRSGRAVNSRRRGRRDAWLPT